MKEVFWSSQFDFWSFLLPILATLHLGDNKISGQIPSELSALLSLETLQLSQNQFRGTIPTAFGTMQSLSKYEWTGIKAHVI